LIFQGDDNIVEDKVADKRSEVQAVERLEPGEQGVGAEQDIRKPETDPQGKGGARMFGKEGQCG
jgi:hypothetical protein